MLAAPAIILRSCTCHDTDFTAADIHYSVLTGSDLTDADLTDADITGVDLTEANIQGVKGLGTRETEMEFAQWLLKELTNEHLFLEMSTWHTCSTTHCIAGHWDNEALNGKEASTQIPTLAKYFSASESEALAALARVASGEESIFPN